MAIFQYVELIIDYVIFDKILNNTTLENTTFEVIDIAYVLIVVQEQYAKYLIITLMKTWYWIISVFVIITTINNVQQSIFINLTTPTIVLMTTVMIIKIIPITNRHTPRATKVHQEYDFQQLNNNFINLLFTFGTHGLTT